jgi:hypothetical protein
MIILEMIRQIMYKVKLMKQKIMMFKKQVGQMRKWRRSGI